jgi:hypothetical protein
VMLTSSGTATPDPLLLRRPTIAARGGEA